MSEPTAYLIEPMRLGDLAQVMAIERASFRSPWSWRAYAFEITENEHSTMLVIRPAAEEGNLLKRLRSRLRRAPPPPVLGYGGFWLLVDEAHISTLAVHPRWRRRGLGEMLLLALLEQAQEQGAGRATLEVRVSNLAAQDLYRKLGFEVTERRKRYYADNNEDAYIMTTPPFDDPLFREKLARLQKRTLSLYHPSLCPKRT